MSEYTDEDRETVREYDAVLHRAITRIIKNVDAYSGVHLKRDELFFIWEQFLAAEAEEVADNTRWRLEQIANEGGGTRDFLGPGYATKHPKPIEDLQALSTEALIVMALRRTLEEPLSQGQMPRDCAANARLLAELTGLLGKHSKPPTDPDQPAHEMSREDLERVAAETSLTPPKPKRRRKKQGENNHMAVPSIPARLYSYTNHSVTQPDQPHDGDKLDAEFNQLIATDTALLAFMRQAIEDDGTIKLAAISAHLASVTTGPQGPQGDPGTDGADGADGQSYVPDAIGVTADRTQYNAEIQGFAFLDTEAGLLYWKLSNTVADWSTGVAFGQGPAGPAGATGPAGPTGATGATGAAGTNGADGAQGPQGTPGMVPRGAWDNATAYITGDIVTVGGTAVYVALQDHTGRDPATETLFWTKILDNDALVSSILPDGPTGTFTRPRMTTTARDALDMTSKAAGYEIYNTTTGQVEAWDGTSVWGAVRQPLQAANVPAIEAWVETAYAVPEVIPELSPDQFEYLLALTGLEDVWDAVEADLKANNRPAYATLRAQRKKASFAFEVAMGFVEQFAASIPSDWALHFWPQDSADVTIPWYAEPLVWLGLVNPHDPDLIAAAFVHDKLLREGHDARFAAAEFRRAYAARIDRAIKQGRKPPSSRWLVTPYYWGSRTNGHASNGKTRKLSKQLMLPPMLCTIALILAGCMTNRPANVAEMTQGERDRITALEVKQDQVLKELGELKKSVEGMKLTNAKLGGVGLALTADEAREDLLRFTQLMMPDPLDMEDPDRSLYQVAAVHRKIAEECVRCMETPAGRLIINCPPRHGKSQLVTKSGIPWFMGRNPQKSVIFATYNETFAKSVGREVREVFQTPAYRQVFPEVSLSADEKASGEMKIKDGGRLALAGRGGTVTGKGADGLFLDDPIKNSEEADSQLTREGLWDWFNRTVSTRLMTDKAFIILVQTRWHEDDLVGRLTDPNNPNYLKAEARNWRVVDLPAFAEDDDPLGRKPGAALWPERFSVNYLKSIQRRDPDGFSALFQGRPANVDGAFFTQSIIHEYDPATELPDLSKATIYAAADLAVATKTSNDKTAIIPAAVDQHDNIFILPNAIWERMKSDVAVEKIIQLIRLDKPVALYSEAENVGGPVKADEVEEARRTEMFISHWLSRVQTAKQYWETRVFKRIRKNRLFHKGFQWEQTPDIIKKSLAEGKDDSRQVVNITQRYIKQQTATLYGKNPKIVVRHKERMMLSAWDGSHDEMQRAQQTMLQLSQMDPTVAAIPAMAQFMEAQLAEAAAILGEVQEYKQYKRQARNHARTLELALEHCYAEQPEKFKTMMKNMVRRALICGAAFVKQVYHRTTDGTPQMLKEIDRLRTQLLEIERLTNDVQEGDLEPEEDAKGEELKIRLEQLVSLTETVLFEGLLLTAPDPTSIIPDTDVKNLRSWNGAGYIAEEFLLTAEAIETTYAVDIKGQGTPYVAPDEAAKRLDGFKVAADRAALGSNHAADNGKGLSEMPGTLFAVYEVWDKTTGMVFTICDGVKTYLKAPAPPSYAHERFFPYHTLMFNDADGPDDVWPQSDIELGKPMQMEINRAAEGLKEHRNANRPGWITPKGAFGEKEQKNVFLMPAHGVAQMSVPSDGSVDISKVIQRKPTAPIDPAQYDTNGTMQNFMHVLGTQQAELGGVSGASATEAAIAEGAKSTASGADTDELDDFLTELTGEGGQLLMANMPVEYVKKAVGPAAVWSELRREEVLREYLAEVEAGSTGRPNQAQEIQNYQIIAPILAQVPGVKPEFLAREGLRRLDDRIDLPEAFAAGQPSIMAMNGIATSQASPAGQAPDPKANATPGGQAQGPEAQGQEGHQNAPNPVPPQVNAAPRSFDSIPNGGGFAQ
eukprot:g17239.t1